MPMGASVKKPICLATLGYNLKGICEFVGNASQERI